MLFSHRSIFLLLFNSWFSVLLHSHLHLWRIKRTFVCFFLSRVCMKTCNLRTEKYQFYCPSLNMLARGFLVNTNIKYVVVDVTHWLLPFENATTTKLPNLTGLWVFFSCRLGCNSSLFFFLHFLIIRLQRVFCVLSVCMPAFATKSIQIFKHYSYWMKIEWTQDKETNNDNSSSILRITSGVRPENGNKKIHIIINCVFECLEFGVLVQHYVVWDFHKQSLSLSFSLFRS